MKRFCDCDNPGCKQCKTDAYHNAENEKLQAQVAMLRDALVMTLNNVAGATAIIELALKADASDWLQQVRDEAYERAARKVVHCDDRHKAAEAIRNLKGTK